MTSCALAPMEKKTNGSPITLYYVIQVRAVRGAAGVLWAAVLFFLVRRSAL